jgi:hypothetical protein
MKSPATPLIWRGLLAILVGLIAVAWPGITVGAVVILFAVYAFLSAGMQALRAFRSETAGHVAGGLVLALLDVAAGVIALAWPGITALALALLVAVWAFLTGINELFLAFGAGETAGERAMLGLITDLSGARPGVRDSPRSAVGRYPRETGGRGTAHRSSIADAAWCDFTADVRLHYRQTGIRGLPSATETDGRRWRCRIVRSARGCCYRHEEIEMRNPTAGEHLRHEFRQAGLVRNSGAEPKALPARRRDIAGPTASIWADPWAARTVRGQQRDDTSRSRRMHARTGVRTAWGGDPGATADRPHESRLGC